MPAASVMVKDCEVSADFVKKGYEPRRDRIQKGFDARFGEGRGEDMVRVLDAVVGDMDARKVTLVAADLDNVRELADDPTVRADLGRAVAETRAVIAAARNMGRDTYGPQFLPRLGLDGPTPRDAPGVRQYARVLLHALESVDELPEPLFPDFEPALTALATPLRRVLGTLEEAMEAGDREKREYEVTLQAKHQAMDAFEESFDLAASMVSKVLWAVGDRELAAKLQPSTRRRGVSSSVEEGETEPPAPPAEDDAAEPATPAAPASGQDAV